MSNDQTNSMEHKVVDLTGVPTIPADKINAYYQALGMTVASSGGVESSLMYLFTSLLRPTEYQCAHNLFLRSGQGFNGQLGMVSVLVESASLSEELVLGWKRLKRRIDECQSKRNQVAHMYTWHMNGHGLFGHSPKKDRGELPIDWQERQNHPDVVTTEKMKLYAADLDAVAREIMEYEKLVRSHFHKSAAAK